MTHTSPHNTPLPTYNQYKDTGLPWLGLIPAYWEVKKLKFIANVYNGDSLNVEQKRRFNKKSDDSVPYISTKEINLIDNSVNYNTGITIPRKLPYKIALKNSSLLCIEGGSAGRKLTFLNKDVSFVNKLAAIKIMNNDNCDKFLFYALQSQIFKSQFNIALSGLIGGVTISDINNFLFFLPPKPEQTAIADFLDCKTTQIDQAIAQKQALIERLTTYKQIIIQQAVTKGLQPNTPLKDSGVEWIGKIPAHWEVRKLKYLGKSIIGLTYRPNEVTTKENGTLVLRSSNLYNGKFKYGEKENVYVRTSIPDKLIINKDDILICSRNGSRNLIGKSAIATKQDEGASFGAFTTVFRSEMNKYLFNIFNSEIFKFISGQFLTSTINQLTIGNLNSIKVPIPPEKERKEIQNFLEHKTTQIDRSIALQEAEIGRLQTYKTVLIDQAVTGKIKVI